MTDPVLDASWVVAPTTLARRSLDGILVFPRDCKEPLFLSGSGSQLWELTRVPKRFGQVIEELATQYERDAGTIANDLAPIWRELIRIGAFEESR